MEGKQVAIEELQADKAVDTVVDIAADIEELESKAELLQQVAQAEAVGQQLLAGALRSSFDPSLPFSSLRAALHSRLLVLHLFFLSSGGGSL